MITGEHAEWLLGQGVCLAYVAALMSEAEAVREIPTRPERIPVSFSSEDPDTERQQTNTTWPAAYSRETIHGH